MTTASHCLACGGRALRPFYEVRDIPVHSCLMVNTREAALAFPRGDLRLDFCATCGFVQNSLYDPSLQSYSPDYEETQAFSPTFMAFLRELADDQIRRHGLRDKQLVEIGCGKGEFLVLLCELGGNLGIGIDPGYRPERTTSPVRDRITFIRDFYSERYAHLTGDYVCCRHTLEHIGPVHDFVALVRQSLAPGTPVLFELPDFERVLVEQTFWDIYYEHCSYFTAGSLRRLFERCGFATSRLTREYRDQYLLWDGTVAGEQTVGDAPDDLARIQIRIESFGSLVAGKRRGFETMLRRLADEGKRVVIWGSGSKAVSILTTLRCHNLIAAVVDINPHKHGKFLAGTGHEIVGPRALDEIRPDQVIVMNPIYLEEIARELAAHGLHPAITALEQVPPDEDA